MSKPAIGLIGVGLMGHGLAWNIAKSGYSLTILDHPGNQPVADLRDLGVRVAPGIRELVEAAEIVILCVTGSPQVEAILAGSDGVIAHLRPGMVVVDCSTALPDSSKRMAEAVAATGAEFLDAAMTRLPPQARAGTLNLLIGGDPALLERVRPVLDTFSENITHIGDVGSGHLMKLLHKLRLAGHGDAAGGSRRAYREGWHRRVHPDRGVEPGRRGRYGAAAAHAVPDGG